VNAADHYLTDRVMTASPAQLTDMLFQGAVAALRGAARMQEAGDFAGALPRSLKAQRILVELRTSLDHSAGGELTANLDRLYAWAHGNLVQANSTRNAKGTRDALGVVEDLATAWRESCVGVAAPVPA
jgi:flagellar protein FliS